MGIGFPLSSLPKGSQPNKHQLRPSLPRSDGQLYRRLAADGRGGSPSRLGLTQLGCQWDCDMPGQDRRPGRQAGKQAGFPRVIDARWPKGHFLSRAQPRMVPVEQDLFLGPLVHAPVPA